MLPENKLVWKLFMKIDSNYYFISALILTLHFIPFYCGHKKGTNQNGVSKHE